MLANLPLAEILSEPQAAAWLGCSPHTLRQWRSAGSGPRWFRLGPRMVRYALTDLREFALEAQEV